MTNCIIVGLGGFLGAVARYLIGLIPINPQNGFPVKTLLINIAGAFVIGLVVALGAKKDWNPQLILFLKVGICGGFTTFSNFNPFYYSVIGALAAVYAAQYAVVR